MVPFKSASKDMAFPLIVCFTLGAWIIVMLQRRLLLRTKVAKDNGYTAADINVRPPLCRRDYLALGVFAALAGTMALLAVLIAI